MRGIAMHQQERKDQEPGSANLEFRPQNLALEGSKLETRNSSGARRAEPRGDVWRLTTADTVWEAPVLVAASGISSNPYTPPIPGLAGYQGRVLHSSAYQTADPFAGQDVLVVGMGNSGTEIALDLAR